MKLNKLDSNTIEIVEEVSIEEKKSTYIYNDLVANRDRLLAQIASLQDKLADAESLVSQADSLGVVMKVFEPPVFSNPKV